MNKNLITRALLITLFSAASINVWSQTSGNHAASAVQAEAASHDQNAKSARRANHSLRRSIYKALAKHTEIDAGNISIVAKNGLVTLNGTVTDADQIGTVEGVTRSIPGVLSVTNKLTVQRPIDE